MVKEKQNLKGFVYLSSHPQVSDASFVTYIFVHRKLFVITSPVLLSAYLTIAGGGVNRPVVSQKHFSCRLVILF